MSTSVPATWLWWRGLKPATEHSSQGRTCRSTQEHSGRGTRWDGCKDASIRAGGRRSRCSNTAGQEQPQQRQSSKIYSAPRSKPGTTPSGYHGASGPSSRSGTKDCTKVQNSVACEKRPTIAQIPRHRLPLVYLTVSSIRPPNGRRHITAFYSG